MILIVGSEGSMGKRYQAILTHLKQRFLCVDKFQTIHEIFEASRQAMGIIIATPTNTHFSFINIFAPLKIPILCEKPLVMNLRELIDIKKICQDFSVNLTMQLQYEMLDDPKSEGDSYYNYFRHGTDGLFWDCLQIIALARGKVEVAEDSPIWQCTLNGKKLNIKDMDEAYISFVKKWLDSPGQDLNWILGAHKKTQEYAEKMTGQQ